MRFAPLNFWINIYSTVAAPGGGNRGNVSPEHKFFRAERMRIDSKKNF